MNYVTVDIPRVYPLTNEFLADILTIAAEGGIGYWTSYRTVRNADGYVTAIRDMTDAETGEAFPELGVMGVVAFNHLATAINRVLKQDPIITASAATRLLECVIANDACDLDAEDCDTLVQVALFGEVIYG